MEMCGDAGIARRLRPGCWSLGVVLGFAMLGPGVPAAAAAASLSGQELQIVGRAIGFMQPPPEAGPIAVVYAASDPASRADAEAIAGEIGSGLAVAGTRFPPKLVAAPIPAGGGFALAIAAAGAATPALAAALRTAHLLCVTADIAAVQAGSCTMGIVTRPRVEIVLNHAAAAASGIDFAIAFRMMIREM